MSRYHRKVDAKLKEYQCIQCHELFVSYYKNRSFCDRKCFGNYYSSHKKKRSGGNIDRNHHEIKEFLIKNGALIIDTSRIGYGCPDLVVKVNENVYLAEIKNPKTGSYSKKLNINQKNFALDWQGGPVYLIRNIQDTSYFFSSELHKIQSFGGYRA